MATTAAGTPYVESSDLVANYPGASEALAERIDIVGVNPFADSAARATAIPSPTEGMMSSLNDTDAVERYDGATWKPVGGKVLQVVKGTDVTTRTTSSTSFVDASISVTITPQKIDSEIILIWSLSFNHLSTSDAGKFQITDNTNNTLNGAQNVTAGSGTTSQFFASQAIFAYDSPATLSATTYKGRFSVDSSGTNRLDNNLSTGQLYAIEVAA